MNLMRKKEVCIALESKSEEQGENKSISNIL